MSDDWFWSSDSASTQTNGSTEQSQGVFSSAILKRKVVSYRLSEKYTDKLKQKTYA
jgi:hypothetical protein